MQLKKEILKNVFWAPKLAYKSPKQPEYIIGIYTDKLKFFLLENSLPVCL